MGGNGIRLIESSDSSDSFSDTEEIDEILNTGVYRTLEYVKNRSTKDKTRIKKKFFNSTKKS